MESKTPDSRRTDCVDPRTSKGRSGTDDTNDLEDRRGHVAYLLSICNNWSMNSSRDSALGASDAVIDAVLLASRALVAVAARSLSDVGEEVTLAQYRTLVLLANQGPQSMAKLAEAVGVTPATATRMCDRLVKKKLITRRTEQVDRRQMRVRLTEKGQALVESVSKRRRREIKRILSVIPPKEQASLVHALSQFTSADGEVPDQDWSVGWDL